MDQKPDSPCTFKYFLFKKRSWVVRLNKNFILFWQAEDGHLDMMDGLIVELLKDKWKTFVGHRCVKFWAQLLVFFQLNINSYRKLLANLCRYP